MNCNWGGFRRYQCRIECAPTARDTKSLPSPRLIIIIIIIHEMREDRWGFFYGEGRPSLGWREIKRERKRAVIPAEYRYCTRYWRAGADTGFCQRSIDSRLGTDPTYVTRRKASFYERRRRRRRREFSRPIERTADAADAKAHRIARRNSISLPRTVVSDDPPLLPPPCPFVVCRGAARPRAER